MCFFAGLVIKLLLSIIKGICGSVYISFETEVTRFKKYKI